MAHTIKFNKKEIARIEKAIDLGLQAFGEELIEIIKERQVTPKKTGNLESNHEVEHYSKNHIRIVNTTDYARKLYYNKEGLTIHRAEKKGKANKNEKYKDENGEKIIRNRWAQDHWLEPILYSKNNKDILAKYIKGFVGYGTTDFNYDKKEKVTDIKPVEIKKPIESEKPNKPIINDDAIERPVAVTRPARPGGSSGMSASEYRAAFMARKKNKH